MVISSGKKQKSAISRFRGSSGKTWLIAFALAGLSFSSHQTNSGSRACGWRTLSRCLPLSLSPCVLHHLRRKAKSVVLFTFCLCQTLSRVWYWYRDQVATFNLQPPPSRKSIPASVHPVQYHRASPHAAARTTPPLYTTPTPQPPCPTRATATGRKTPSAPSPT